MTQEQRDYIEAQLNIIQGKATIDDLNRYQSLLDGASLEAHVKTPLIKACDVRREELDRISPMAVNGDIDDMGGQ
ncbi:hypothetical protein [Sulfurovum mangrovi]|uniref:hypothetical protein n=1 Tax=Sulfurovum mangrovi TaxID=2893889 RepID=UPI001E470EA2|nr:hypothetical protein [Sulfurovum mangrovi]UFH59815.1 hypothetical protein LN246_02980 [Sulfurovum mangrovi]UFH59866.1 hypothetical protein LN246_03240 [Sulfurovum mangrovi]UFH60612.1 hypothetical protein LN246_13625 [Sulfurovum mangrovi]